MGFSMAHTVEVHQKQTGIIKECMLHAPGLYISHGASGFLPPEIYDHIL